VWCVCGGGGELGVGSDQAHGPSASVQCWMVFGLDAPSHSHSTTAPNLSPHPLNHIDKALSPHVHQRLPDPEVLSEPSHVIRAQPQADLLALPVIGV